MVSYRNLFIKDLKKGRLYGLNASMYKKILIMTPNSLEFPKGCVEKGCMASDYEDVDFDMSGRVIPSDEEPLSPEDCYPLSNLLGADLAYFLIQDSAKDVWEHIAMAKFHLPNGWSVNRAAMDETLCAELHELMTETDPDVIVLIDQDMRGHIEMATSCECKFEKSRIAHLIWQDQDKIRHFICRSRFLNTKEQDIDTLKLFKEICSL